MRSAGLDELQAGIKVDRRNINNLRYADYITIMEKSKKELTSLLMRVREEHERAGLRLNFFNVFLLYFALQYCIGFAIH